MSTRALVLVDGEHYPPVVRAALDELEHDVVAAVLVGGTEKLRGAVDDETYGVPLALEVDGAIATYRPQLVVDLSDEPVLGPVERLALASRVLAAGIPYEGADFRLEPPAFEPFDLPSLAVVGTGKRVGKTSVTGHLARLLSRDRRVVVTAMGRGGPPEPETISVRPTVADLVELSRSGRHAASDHLETAAVAGVATVGCRRCGGGLAGQVASSNVAEGARIAAALGPELVIFDGSGAALPPVAVDRRLVVVGGHQDPAVGTGYLNAYRLLLADLALVTMAEPGSEWQRVRVAAGRVVRPGVPVVGTVLRPRPLEPVARKAVAYFSTAPASAHATLRAHLVDAHGADVVHVSGALADRASLLRELESVDAAVYLVELKAAAIDLVAEAALARGAEVVLAANDLVAAAGEPELDEVLLEMAKLDP